jgi:hypothetical protein
MGVFALAIRHPGTVSVQLGGVHMFEDSVTPLGPWRPMLVCRDVVRAELSETRCFGVKTLQKRPVDRN